MRCERECAVEGITETAITTNGTLLPQMAVPLHKAGIQRINLSLDTLNEEKYRHITRRGELKDALDGIHAALDAGFEKVKEEIKTEYFYDQTGGDKKEISYTKYKYQTENAGDHLISCKLSSKASPRTDFVA